VPRFMVERTVNDISMEMLEQITRRSKEVLTDMSGVRWIRSFVSEAEGKIYCEYDAPSADLIREASRRAGLPVDRISEVSIEISPEMFR
jgi:hypothetical protein